MTVYGYRSGVGRTLSFSGRAIAAPTPNAPAQSVVYVRAPAQYAAPAQALPAGVREIETTRGAGFQYQASEQAQQPEQPLPGAEPLPMPESYYVDSDAVASTQTDLTSGKGYAIGIGALALLALLLLAGKNRKRKRRL